MLIYKLGLIISKSFNAHITISSCIKKLIHRFFWLELQESIWLYSIKCSSLVDYVGGQDSKLNMKQACSAPLLFEWEYFYILQPTLKFLEIKDESSYYNVKSYRQKKHD